ncbi:MAG: FAD-dependent oxidoreductase, partial [Candidatus Omnitrophica bacterium]|nr:FAD-dependent oxidoreductase [Candidatus Omnitrophota bacterium]
MENKFDYLIIGCGIIGLSIARQLKQTYPQSRILLIDKESEEAFHASGRNSGVLHAGFYYSADTLKARFTVEGNHSLKEYCIKKKIPINT